MQSLPEIISMYLRFILFKVAGVAYRRKSLLAGKWFNVKMVRKGLFGWE